MSKSYAKYKTLGVCTGSNTEYYRMRNRLRRRKNNHSIKNIMANFKNEEFDDIFLEFKIPKKDSWDEPTDGTWKVYAKDLSKYPYIRGVYKTKNKKIKK